MRLIVGLPVPLPVENRLSALRLRLAAPKDGLRWTGPEQWLLTLRFFGDLESHQLSSLQQALSRFRHEPPLLRMETLGLFAAKGILYAAIQPSQPLSALHTALTREMPFGLTADASLPFHPHITLARSKGPIGLKSLRQLATPALPSFGPPLQWSASPIHLFESVLGPQGAVYHIVATQDLTAS